jgi:cytochrome c oxidase assembly factor CtaG
LLPALARAHAGESLAPHDAAAAWALEPWTLLWLGALAACFALGQRRLATRRHGAGRSARSSFFWLGWGTLAIALVSPLHAMGGVLFSAHMTQHELLVTVAAPLLVLARPAGPLLWGMRDAWRRQAARAFRAPPLRQSWRLLTRGDVATALHGVALWAWHAPRLYELTLTSDVAHTAQHVSFFGTAILFWWAVLRPGQAHRGAAVGWLFLTALHTTALGALLTFATSLWYPAYAATTAPWGLMPMEDQALAGLIMWIPGGVGYLAAALMLLGGLLREPAGRPASALVEGAAR